MNQVAENMREAFDVALSVDGDHHDFAFSDGCSSTGRIYSRIKVLWVRDLTSYLHLHTHDYNTVVYHADKILMMRARDVPDRAHLYSGDYLDIDDTSYKIVSARTKDDLWHLELSVIGTT